MPEGTVVAAFHSGDDGASGPVFVMDKTSAGWRYLVLDASGVPMPGSTRHCARCHVEARADSLFGLVSP